MLKIAFIRTKVNYFLACLPLKACNKLKKIIQIWGCTEAWMFSVSQHMSPEAVSNEKEGCRKKRAFSLVTCLSDNSHGHQIITITISHTSPSRIMNTHEGGACWSTCWGEAPGDLI